MKQLFSETDFADSSFNSCRIEGGKLEVEIISWKEKLLKIVFFNPIHVLYRPGSFVAGIFENNKDGKILSILSSYEGEISDSQSFHSYLIRDIENNHIFEIVAEKISLTFL